MSTDATNPLDEVSVSLANLSDDARTQVLDAVEAAHGSEDLDVRQVVHDAEAADYHRAQADEYQQLQAKAAGDGDWETARDYAAKAAGELDAVADHGGSDIPAAQAQEDVTELDNARWEQRQANENARAATSYSQAGDSETAQLYASEAGRHQVLADESGHEGIAGARESQAESGGLHDDSAQTPEHAPDDSAVTATAEPDHTATATPEPTPEPDHTAGDA